MSLLEEAKRVAAEFELGDEDVGKTVKHFIEQMSKFFPSLGRVHVESMGRDSKAFGQAQKDEYLSVPRRN